MAATLHPIDPSPPIGGPESLGMLRSELRRQLERIEEQQALQYNIPTSPQRSTSTGSLHNLAEATTGPLSTSAAVTANKSDNTYDQVKLRYMRSLGIVPPSSGSVNIAAANGRARSLTFPYPEPIKSAPVPITIPATAPAARPKTKIPSTDADIDSDSEEYSAESADSVGSDTGSHGSGSSAGMMTGREFVPPHELTVSGLSNTFDEWKWLRRKTLKHAV